MTKMMIALAMTEKIIVEEPIEKVTVGEVMTALRKMKFGKATGLSEMDSEMVIASRDTGIKVMVELCLCVRDGRGMQEKWETSVVAPIFKGKGDVVSCGAYKEVK